MKKSLLIMLVILVAPAAGSAQVTAAEEAYRQAESKYHIYMEMQFTSAKPRDLAKQLQKKSKLLLELEKAYRKVIDFKEPVFTVSALYKMACANKNMADVLTKIPVPAGLTPEQAEIYVQALMDKAVPFEQKALQLFKATVKKAKELGVFTDHAHLAEETLREFEKKPEPGKKPTK